MIAAITVFILWLLTSRQVLVKVGQVTVDRDIYEIKSQLSGQAVKSGMGNHAFCSSDLTRSIDDLL